MFGSGLDIRSVLAEMLAITSQLLKGIETGAISSNGKTTTNKKPIVWP